MDDAKDNYMTTRQEGDSRTEYGYTSSGQLVSVEQFVYVEGEGVGTWVPDESYTTITYHLDALGRRIAKQVGETIVEKYLWAGYNTTLLAVYDGSDTLIARFDYGVGRLPMRMTQGSDTYYFAYDQVGSLRGVFNSSGTLVYEIRYDSWGNILFETDSSGLCVPFGFAGGLHDRDTGLVLFGFRDYDPETSRWITLDPIGFSSGDLHLYGYCAGDPVCKHDPQGLVWWNPYDWDVPGPYGSVDPSNWGTVSNPGSWNNILEGPQEGTALGTVQIGCVGVASLMAAGALAVGGIEVAFLGNKSLGFGIVIEAAHRGLGPHLNWGPWWLRSTHPRWHFGPLIPKGFGRIWPGWKIWWQNGHPWRWMAIVPSFLGEGSNEVNSDYPTPPNKYPTLPKITM